jgi:hypothetical protein
LPNWTEKIISIPTDGASIMTGCHAGLDTHIERAANAGFFCVWCAVHQFDLVVQARCKSMFNKTFVHVIYNGKKIDHIDEINMSMGQLLDWLIAKRLPLQANFEARQLPC